MAAPKLRPFESLYRTLLRNAKVRSKVVELSYEEFLDFTKIPLCHYCNAPLIWRMYRKLNETFAYNLDCKDSHLGYTKENCVVCCHRCNDAKLHHFTYEEWLQVGNLIKSWKK